MQSSLSFKVSQTAPRAVDARVSGLNQILTEDNTKYDVTLRNTKNYQNHDEKIRLMSNSKEVLSKILK